MRVKGWGWKIMFIVTYIYATLFCTRGEKAMRENWKYYVINEM